MNDREERWADILGYEGRYRISDHGRVKSLDRYVSVCGNGQRLIKSKNLNGGTSRGYKTVMLYKNQKYESFYVHRLVATYFVDNSNNLNIVDHINQKKLQNHYENLQWVTAAENAQYKYKKFKAKGYYYNKRDNNYIVRIKTFDIQIGLARCKTKTEANLIYREAYKEWYGIDIA